MAHHKGNGCLSRLFKQKPFVDVFKPEPVDCLPNKVVWVVPISPHNDVLGTCQHAISVEPVTLLDPVEQIPAWCP
jgi:hypothetical protein